MVPAIPARAEAESIPIFAISSSGPSPNAKLAINSDMVKPMPHSQLAPKICFQATPAGGEASVDLAPSHAKAVIPRGLPTNNPSVTPRVTGWDTAARMFPMM